MLRRELQTPYIIAGQLKNLRKAMKKAKGIEITEQSNIKGIQVQIAGCQIARAEWDREGRVPLQTLRAKINYYSYTIRNYLWGLRYKNLDICRRGIVNPYLGPVCLLESSFLLESEFREK